MALGFAFPYGGDTYNRISVDANGAIVLKKDNTVTVVNSSIWDKQEFQRSFSNLGQGLAAPVLLPFNTSLSQLLTGGQVQFKTFNNTFSGYTGKRAVVTWVDSTLKALRGTADITFQAQLFEDGTIIFSYQTLTSPSGAGWQSFSDDGIVVGVSNGDGAWPTGRNNLNGVLDYGIDLIGYETWCKNDSSTDPASCMQANLGNNGAFDLNDKSVVFNPDGSTGFLVSPDIKSGTGLGGSGVCAVSSGGGSGSAAAPPPLWESSYSSILLNGTNGGATGAAAPSGTLDGQENVALGFAFPYGGDTYNRISVDANGAIILKKDNTVTVVKSSIWDKQEFQRSFSNLGQGAAAPVLLPFNTSLSQLLTGGQVQFKTFNNTFSGYTGKRAVVTWVNSTLAQLRGTADITFQAQLFEDGTIIFSYQTLTSPSGAGWQNFSEDGIVVGISNGNGKWPTGRDNLNAIDFGVDLIGYEIWCKNDSSTVPASCMQANLGNNGAFDLNNKSVVFNPDGSTGFLVSPDIKSGTGSGGSDVCAVPPVVAVPTIPQTVSATAGDGQVTVSWDAVLGATSYTVYWDTAGGVTTGDFTLVPGANTQIVHTPLSNGTARFYRVVATNASGSSGLSSEVTATPLPPVPTIPQTVSATAGDEQVTVSWDAVSDATSYKVYWKSPTGGVTTSDTEISAGASTQIVHNSLTNNTAYFYRVVATNSGGASGLSSEESATPVPPPPPGIPQSVAAVAGNTQVTVSWNTVSGATNYTVYWKSPTGGITTGNSTAISAGTSTQIVHNSLSNGTEYFYRVEATNSNGSSDLSSEESATPMAPPPPDSPLNVDAVAANEQVTVSWNAVSGATSYTVYWKSPAGGITTGNSTAIGAGTSTQIVHNSLSNGTEYFYRVEATNSNGSSDLSSEESATPMAPPPPDSPLNVDAVAANEQVTVSWNAVSGATSYTVYWKSPAGGITTGNSTAIGAGTSTQIVHNSLSNGTEYFYRVEATNNSGSSNLSSEVSATPVAPPAPTSPQNVSATAGDGIVTVSWTAVSGATSYTVYWDTTGSVTTADATLNPGASTEIVHTPLPNGTTHFYRVVATNIGGSSGLSSEVSATPVLATPRVAVDDNETAATNAFSSEGGGGSFGFVSTWLMLMLVLVRQIRARKLDRKVKFTLFG